MAVDQSTGDLLDLIAASDGLDHHRAEVERVILAVADADGGVIDPNRVRDLLPGWVKPQAIGPTYRAMSLAGVIEPHGWTTSTDLRGRNSGKPARTYRLVPLSAMEVPF